VGLDVGDGIADGLEVLGLVVGNGDPEQLLTADQDLDHRETVDVQVLHEGLVELHVPDRVAGDVIDQFGELPQDVLGALRHGAFLSSRLRTRRYDTTYRTSFTINLKLKQDTGFFLALKKTLSGSIIG